MSGGAYSILAVDFPLKVLETWRRCPLKVTVAVSVSGVDIISILVWKGSR
jgi:hypothetical protein